jgi:Zn-dependent peptidase ImmA (M78 family)
MNNYSKTYEQFSKFVNLEISEKKFEEFKKRKITTDEINKIISKTSVDKEKEVEQMKNIWNEKEKEIISTMNELSGLKINSKKIICYIDPYQKGGYYGEDNITVGTYKNPEDILFVIAHELFHVFYWRKLAELELTKSTMGNESIKEWELAEVTVHLITTEDKMREHWKNIEIEIYPEIEHLYNKVKDIWENNSFEVYLKKSYGLIEDGTK